MIEEKLIGNLLLKNELIEKIELKYYYFEDKELQEIFKKSEEMYSEYRVIDYQKLVVDNPRLINRISKILVETTSYPSEEALELAQNEILKNFKSKYILKLSDNLKTKKITNEEFNEKVIKLNELSIGRKIFPLEEDEILENIKDSRRIYLKNYPTLNKIMQFTEGDFLVIGARTGAGKSSFMLNLMNDLKENYQCVYFNIEMNKATIYKRMLAIAGNMRVDSVNQDKTQDELFRFNKAIAEVTQAKVIIEHLSYNIDDIEDVIRKLKTNKHKIIFIDHLGLTRTSKSNKSIYEQITEIVKRLRNMCLKYNCTIVGASQLNRNNFNEEKSLDISMLKDSGEIENSASKIILLSQNKDEKKGSLNVNMKVEVAKNRDGKIGSIKMVYDKTKQIFQEGEKE
jgi:dnaB-like helicase N terminal domain